MPTEESSKENDRKCEKAANQEAQEAEVEGLKEMYPTQLTVHVPKWNVWYPTDCHLRLRPHDSCFLDGDPSKKHDFSITLHVKCSAEYPERKPFIELLDPHGLSQDQVKTLLAMLQKESAENEGLVVIGALAYTATEFLTDLSPRAAGSFHDHMLANNAKIEAEKNRKRHDTERKDLEQIEEEMNNRVPEKLPEAEPRTEAETKSIGGRRIVMLSNIPVNRSKPHNYCSEWFGFYENSQLLITEWAFRYNCTTNADQSKTRDFRPFFEKLETTTAMIAGLCGINNGDRNLVQYEFVEVEKRIVTDYSVEILLYVGQKVYATERNMSTASEVFSSQPNLMRTLAAQAIFALRSLHDATLSHTHLAINSVWMSGGVDNCGFRFSDYGSLGPLLELSKMFSEISTKKTVNEEDISPKNGKDRRKQDCFQLGTMLDTLLIASQQNSSVYPDPLHSQQSRAGQILLADFINACQEAKNTDDLMNHEYLHKEQVSEIHVQLYAPFGDEMPREGRLRSEFVVLRMLGKGGFGDVVLVRNKLDMTDYAVKRIPFDNSNEKGNRRTIREAKHIAQLNHPNMVRYFNTWVEECAPRRESSSEDDECAVPIPGKEKEKKKKLKPAKSLELPSAELGNGDSMLPANLQKLVVIPQSKGAVAKEWSASYFGNAERSKCGARHSKAPSVLDTFSDDLTEEDEEAKSDEIDWDAPSEEDEEEEEISDDSDEEVEDEEEEDDDDGSERRRSTGNDSVFNRSSTADDDDIVFVAASTDPKRKIEKEESEEVQKPIESRSRETDLVVRNPRVLCIQMEYCDKSTLRHCIDSNQLINDRAEAWRIFAELLCGLQYLHSSRIIHRDIKPLNIFLTSQNGVKIGDFGLATVVPLNPKKKKLVSGTEKSNSSEALLSPQKVKKNKETQQTKDVGTQLYMAPELFGDLSTNDEEKYDFKVDIYSAGVVLFEMFYRPLPSGMERVSTLNALRDKLEIPADFGKVPQQDEKATEVVRKTVQLMMARNPEHRPSAEFLLNDDDLPMHTKEDNTFKRLCGKVIKRRDGRMNGWILEQQFKEDVPTAVNYLYDVDMCQERQKYNYREALVETVREEFCKILKVHAFEKVATHTLIPVSTAMAVASVNTKPVEFLDRSGIPVALPMDLRQNFVRYCVRNSIQRLKRFNFGRVYSLNAPNLHPKEKWECSVDCIGPQSSSTSLEAELLHIASEMVTTSLPKLKLTLKIGHSSLIEAQIRQLKLTDDTRCDLLDLLHLFSVSDKTISQKEKHEQLAAKVTEKTASQFLKLMPIAENNFNSFKEKVNAARKKLNASANELALKAIKELEEIVKLFKFCRNEELQKLEIIYDANLCYRPRTFADGLVFQVQAEKIYSGGKKGRKCTVLAGGRYDSALLRERRPRDFVYRFPLCISGFGVNMDKMALMREINCKAVALTEKCPTQGKVLICSKEQPNGSNLIQEKFRLAKKFWNVGIQADVFHNPVDKLESLNDHRVRASITHIVALTNENLEAVISTSSGFHKVNFEQILQSVCRDTQSLALQNTHQTPNGPSGTATTPGESGHEDHSTPVIATRASRSASASHVSGSLRASSATVANLNVIFAMSGDRYHKFIKEKKRVENQVSTHLADFVTQFSSKTKIEVIVVDVSIDIIKRIVGDITKTSSTTEFEAVFDSLAQSRVDLTQLKKQLHSTLHGSSSGFGAGHVVILYRNADNFYRCLT